MIGILRALFPCLLSSLLAQSALGEQLLLAEGRNMRSLNGQWHYIVDPQNVGALTHDGKQTRRGYHRDLDVAHSERLQEYDFSAAPVLQVPGSWTAQSGDLLHYQGAVWLQRRFDFSPRTEPGRHFLHFEAVNHHAVVFLNGIEVGRHEGGFTPFSLEVSEVLKVGENSLVVHVDNRRSADTLPGERFDWWNYGGITREVFLVSTPQAFVRNFRLQLSPLDPQLAVGWVQVDGGLGEVEVRIADGDWQGFDLDGLGRAALSFPAPTALWSPDRPIMHDVAIRYREDMVSEPIGFRIVITRGRDILVNGEEVFLRGISVHEEKFDGSDRMATREDAREVLEAITAMNGNYARLTHYPHNRHMARVADELGLLLWAEVPVYWDVDFSNPRILELAKLQLSELIRRDGNRASVIIWSVGNETPPGDERNQFLSSLARHVRAEDHTRLVSAAAIPTRESLEQYARLLAEQLQNPGADSVQEVEINDPLADQFDVIAYNQYMGWYDPPLLSNTLGVDERSLRKAGLAVIPRVRIKAAVDKPLILSEFGAGAVKGREGGQLDVWTEAYQAQVYRAQLAMVEDSSGIAGISPWVLKDFRSPRRPLAGIQDYYNRKGVLDEKGNPKQAYTVLRDFYADTAR